MCLATVPCRTGCRTRLPSTGHCACPPPTDPSRFLSSASMQTPRTGLPLCSRAPSYWTTCTERTAPARTRGAHWVILGAICTLLVFITAALLECSPRTSQSYSATTRPSALSVTAHRPRAALATANPFPQAVPATPAAPDGPPLKGTAATTPDGRWPGRGAASLAGAVCLLPAFVLGLAGAYFCAHSKAAAAPEPRVALMATGGSATAFHWSASIAADGRAASQEHSTVGRPRVPAASLPEVSEALVQAYPQWLAREGLPLRLLRHRRNADGTESLCVVWVELLRFGPAVLTACAPGPVWALPLKGGLLVGTATGDDGAGAGQGRGATPGPAPEQSAVPDADVDPLTAPSAQPFDPESDAELGWLAFGFVPTLEGGVVLRTGIHEYRSAIVGAGTVRVRRWAYLGTQRLFHAFVMWRYHRWAQKQLCRSDEAVEED